MKYSIIYNSYTGNTKLLAQTILNQLPKEDCEYFGTIHDTESELLFIGFCTDKGNCSEELATYLKTLKDRKIFLFGTAGFGGSQEYFDKILDNVKKYIDESNVIIETYMCQGKMPMTVRQRYEQMANSNPGKFDSLIVNFDNALSHPNSQDLEKLSQLIKQFH
ncbi:MAG: flavodoxin family protein [Coprobacillus sp.]